jgi:hypothetical protein
MRCTNFVLYVIVYVCTIILPVVLHGKEVPDFEEKVQIIQAVRNKILVKMWT